MIFYHLNGKYPGKLLGQKKYFPSHQGFFINLSSVGIEIFLVR